MQVIKVLGKVYGAKLTNAEQEALKIEGMKIMAELNRKNADEIDAMFLWWAHKKLGYGYERLKQFHHEFAPEIRALCERYEMTETGDDVYLCTKMLQEYDPRIDIAAWNEEALKVMK